MYGRALLVKPAGLASFGLRGQTVVPKIALPLPLTAPPACLHPPGLCAAMQGRVILACVRNCGLGVAHLLPMCRGAWSGCVALVVCAGWQGSFSASSKPAAATPALQHLLRPDPIRVFHCAVGYVCTCAGRGQG